MWTLEVITVHEAIELGLLLQEVPAKGIPLSVRIARGRPKSLKARSNTVNA